MLQAVTLRSIVITALLGATFSIMTACGSAAVINTDEITPNPPRAYYLEATIEVAASEPENGPSLFPSDGPVLSTLKLWAGDGAEFRQEIVTKSPAYLSGQNLSVSDGSETFQYDSNLNQYRRSTALPGGMAPISFSSVLIGPIPGGTLNNWTASLKQSTPRFEIRLVRSEDLLGRRVGLYEFSDVGALLDAEGTIATGSTGRLWLDHETGFVLRYESSPIGQSVVAEVTRLDIEPDIGPELFVFDPPEGAERLVDNDPIPIQGSDSQSTLLEVAFVMDDLRRTSGSSSTSNGLITQSEGIWEGLNGRQLRIRQFLRPNGLPAGLESEEVMTAPHAPAPHANLYHVTRSPESGLTSLAWQFDDVTVIMDGIGIELDELLQIANSIQPAS